MSFPSLGLRPWVDGCFSCISLNIDGWTQTTKQLPLTCNAAYRRWAARTRVGLVMDTHRNRNAATQRTTWRGCGSLALEVGGGCPDPTTPLHYGNLIIKLISPSSNENHGNQVFFGYLASDLGCCELRACKTEVQSEPSSHTCSGAASKVTHQWPLTRNSAPLKHLVPETTFWTEQGFLISVGAALHAMLQNIFRWVCPQQCKRHQQWWQQRHLRRPFRQAETTRPKKILRVIGQRSQASPLGPPLHTHTKPSKAFTALIIGTFHDLQASADSVAAGSCQIRMKSSWFENNTINTQGK